MNHDKNKYHPIEWFLKNRNHSSRSIYNFYRNRDAYALHVTPTQIDFGGISVDDISVGVDGLVKNTGYRPLDIESVFSVGDFLLSHNAPTVLLPGQSFKFSVSLSPKHNGYVTGGVYIRTSVEGCNKFIGLSGYGIGVIGDAEDVLPIVSIGNGVLIGDFTQPGDTDNPEDPVNTLGNVSFSPSVISFSPQKLNTISANKQITIHNNNAKPINITAIAITGPFELVAVNTPITIGGASSKNIDLRFKPKTSGLHNGSLEMTIQSLGKKQIPISGSGKANDQPTGVPRLKTLGNQFVTVTTEEPVVLRSVNWFGAEGSNHTPHGTWKRDWRSIVDQIKSFGFNCIRLPFSGDILGATPPINAINWDSNFDLAGKTSLEILDDIIQYCAVVELYVVLDHHRREAGDGADGSPVSSNYTIEDWKNTWVSMATRYKNFPAVIGFDPHNEPHSLTWDVWAEYVEECANAVHDVAPHWIAFVEGVGINPDGTHHWWGGALKGVRNRPITLNIPNRVAYSPHEYSQSVSAQPWLAMDGQTPPVNWPENLNEVWDEQWGYIAKENIAPVWIGEFGGFFGYDGVGAETKPHGEFERVWLEKFISYLKGEWSNTEASEISFAYWSLNPNSVDTGGLLMDDWESPQNEKLSLLAPLLGSSTGLSYEAVPFPGRRLALIGDSITWQNHAWYPANYKGRYMYYAFGACGYWTYANAIMNNRLSLEPGQEPNVNGYHNGMNFGIAGSRVANWWLESHDTLNNGKLEVGPMFAALNNIDHFDVAVLMGGTNDLAGNTLPKAIATNLIKAATQIASQGKWVYLMTIPPRTSDLLNGYPVEQQIIIRQRVEEVNDLLRAFMQKNPPNIFFVDYYADLVGPNGIDPAGMVSSDTDADAPSVLGNYRPEAPTSVFFYDGLHPGVPGAYIMGKKLAQVMLASGIPARQVNKIGPYNLGDNLIANPSFNVTTTRPLLGRSAILGRAIGLGSPLVDTNHPVGTGPYNNVGLGYEHGNVPDYWFVYRSSNTDNESYSNFGEYTWGDLSQQFSNLAPYMAESTWANGSLKTSIVSHEGTRAYVLDFSTPMTGNKNEAFVFWTFIPEGQPGPWNNYNDGNIHIPNTKYSAGDRLGGEMEIHFSNVKSVTTCRTALDVLSINPDNIADTSGAVVTALGMSTNFWPPSEIDVIRMHPEEKKFHVRTPIVTVPPVAPGETRQYIRYGIQVSLDASTGPASIRLLIKNPKVQTVI